MYCEINKKAFKRLIHLADCHKVENDELCRKSYYKTHDSILMQIENFVSCCTQYYIQDINSWGGLKMNTDFEIEFRNLTKKYYGGDWDFWWNTEDNGFELILQVYNQPQEGDDDE